MKKGYLKLSVLVSLFALMLVACDRDRYNGIAHTVYGIWTLNRVGTDANSNSVLESGELTPTGVNADMVVSYKANGTYISKSTTAGNLNGSWFEGNNKIYMIAGGDTTVNIIISITQSQLVTLHKDSVAAGKWFVFQR